MSEHNRKGNSLTKPDREQRAKMKEEFSESLIEIDEFALDREWLRQPKLVMQYALKLADARKAAAEAKAAVDIAEAELELDIRNRPEEYDLKKVTEAAIKATVLVSSVYQSAQRRYNRAKHLVDVLQGIMEALEHRKKALEGLVTLEGRNYFSKPQTTKEGEKALAEATKRKVRKPKE